MNKFPWVASLLVACFAASTGCFSAPASINVTGLPASVVEGAAIPVEVSALDQHGTALPDVEVTWAVTPKDSATHAGKVVSFPKEGTVNFVWTAGDVSTTHQVEVLSPLLGEYERESQPLKGMRMRFRTLGGKVVAEISRPPEVSDEATEWYSDANFAAVKAPTAMKRKYARRAAECRAESFAVGLRKLDEVRRMETDTWECGSLAHTASSQVLPDKPCPRVESAYETMTFQRQADGVLVFTNTANADERVGTKQRWKPVL